MGVACGCCGLYKLGVEAGCSMLVLCVGVSSLSV